MILFEAPKNDGNSLVGVGLVEENMERLKRGEPIHIDMTSLGLPGKEIFLFYGETDRDIYDALAPYINEQTIVRGK